MSCRVILLRRRRALAAILAVLLLGIVLVAWLVPTSKRKSEPINGLTNTADSVEDNEQSFDDMPTSAPFTSILNPPPATYVSPEPPENAPVRRSITNGQLEKIIECPGLIA